MKGQICRFFSVDTIFETGICFFFKDFYTNHLKAYQKRPIYWLFDSGKGNGFKGFWAILNY